MRPHRELRITQKSAWFMLHRLRRATELRASLFEGPVEADESYMGGRKMNMSNARRRAQTGVEDGGNSSKTAVARIKDRATRQVRAKVVERTTMVALQEFLIENTAPGATVYTDVEERLRWHLPQDEP